MKPLCHRIAAVLLLCLLLIGAADAPTQPSKGTYILDLADVVFREHRDFILETSMRAKLETNIEVVVLTVRDLQGLTMEAYAAEIVKDWKLGGSEENYILLLYCSLENEAFLLAGSPLQEQYASTDVIIQDSSFSKLNAPAFLENEMRGYLDELKYSKAVFECYKAIVRQLYVQRGVKPDNRLAASLEPKVGPNQLFWTSLTFIGAMLIMLRGFFVSRRYRQKYGQGRVYRRKRFSRPVHDIEFDIIRGEASAEDDDNIRLDKK